MVVSFLFLKGMTSALASFSYLVSKRLFTQVRPNVSRPNCFRPESKARPTKGIKKGFN